jgi:hypothetical protein
MARHKKAEPTEEPTAQGILDAPGHGATVHFGDGTEQDMATFHEQYEPVPNVIPFDAVHEGNIVDLKTARLPEPFTPIENASVDVEIRTPHYPDVTVPRELPVKFSDSEIREMALELAYVMLELDGLPDIKKRLQLKQDGLSAKIRGGSEERQVKCRWVFECSGVDSDGNQIPNRSYKALFRLDTGAFIEATMMTQEDLQMELSFGAHPESVKEDTEHAPSEEDDGGPL